MRLHGGEVKLQNDFISGNSLINLFNVFGLEGWSADDEGVKDDTDGPSVNLKAVSVRGVEQNFWRDIVWRATDGLLPLAGTLNKCGQTKVADFDVHVCIKE